MSYVPLFLSVYYRKEITGAVRHIPNSFSNLLVIIFSSLSNNKIQKVYYPGVYIKFINKLKNLVSYIPNNSEADEVKLIGMIIKDLNVRWSIQKN